MRCVISAILFFGFAHTSTAANGANVKDIVDHLGADLAIVNMSNNTSSGYALRGTVSKKLDGIMPYLRAEGFLDYTLVPVKSVLKNSTQSSLMEARDSILEVGALAVYDYSINTETSVHGKLGLGYQKMRRSVTCTGVYAGSNCLYPELGKKIVVGFGVGGTYIMDKTINIVADFIKLDITTYLSAGVQYKF